MTGMPEQIAPAPDQVEIEGAVENNKKEPGEKNKEEVKEDAAPQISKNNEVEKDKDADKENITSGENNDKNKGIDKIKGDDDEKNEEGNKDDKKEEKKRKKIFRIHKCTVCSKVKKRRSFPHYAGHARDGAIVRRAQA